jgi:hypothetical protein
MIAVEVFFPVDVIKISVGKFSKSLGKMEQPLVFEIGLHAVSGWIVIGVLVDVVLFSAGFSLGQFPLSRSQ